MGNNKKLECRNCGDDLKSQKPPDCIITFSCEKCGSKSSWKINNLANKFDKYDIPQESTGMRFTKTEKLIFKTTIILIIFFSIFLFFYVFMKNF